MIRASIGITDLKDIWFNENLECHSHLENEEHFEQEEKEINDIK